MGEQTEWEVVDAQAGSQQEQRRAGMTPQQLLRALLGPHWRWKAFGAVVAAAALLAVLAMVVTLAGALALFACAVALVGLSVARFKRWLHRDGARGR